MKKVLLCGIVVLSLFGCCPKMIKVDRVIALENSISEQSNKYVVCNVCGYVIERNSAYKVRVFQGYLFTGTNNSGEDEKNPVYYCNQHRRLYDIIKTIRVYKHHEISGGYVSEEEIHKYKVMSAQPESLQEIKEDK